METLEITKVILNVFKKKLPDRDAKFEIDYHETT